MPRPSSNVLRFGVFELDRDSGELRRHGLKVRLPEQSFQILKALLNRPGEVVTREELRGVLWSSDTYVDFEVGLNSAVRKLREALDDAADNPRFVETLPRRGYRFIATVVAPADTGTVSEPVVEPAVIAPELLPNAGTRPRTRLASWPAAVVLLVAIAAGLAVYGRGGLVSSASPAAQPLRILAVLPFENLTGDPGQEYFVDSVTDALTAHLSQVSGLEVISRTSARQYKQTGKRLRQIGSELQVDGVVEGAVARSGAGVRITVKLIRVATDSNVWAQMYDGDMRHMLALQQRIASEVAVAAGRQRPPPGGTTRPVDPTAYDAYIKGLTAKGLQRYEGFRRAVAYFEEAIAIQPDFGEAHAALSHAQVQLLWGGPLSPHETMPKAEAAARTALQLDPSLVHAHWALGQILSLYHWRWEDGANALLRADAMGGEREELTTALSESLIRRGRMAEAIAVAERGRKTDRLSVSTQVAVGNAYRAAGQYERALAELVKALEMSPDNPRVHFQVGITYMMMGRLDDAIRSLETGQQGAQAYNTRMQAYLGYAYAAANRTPAARKILSDLEIRRRTQYVSSFGIALIHDALGEKEAALAALQRAFDDRAVEFGQMRHYPEFKATASEPSFHAIMQKVGLPR